jgi:hypothetical protein
MDLAIFAIEKGRIALILHNAKITFVEMHPQSQPGEPPCPLGGLVGNKTESAIVVLVPPTSVFEIPTRFPVNFPNEGLSNLSRYLSRYLKK